MAGTTHGKDGDVTIAKEIQKLTEALLDLVSDSKKADGDGDDREQRLRIQRVDFGYRALGTLMGRVSRGSTARFDVPVFAAEWDPGRRVILLSGLPNDDDKAKKVDWIELKNSKEAETLKVIRGRDKHDSSSDADTKDRHGGNQPRVHPTKFARNEAIDSVLGLRHRDGPVVALGPRIDPVQQLL
jgi:hypothetical protein